MIKRPFNSEDAVHRQLLFQSIRLLPPGWYDVEFVPRKRPTSAQRGYIHGVVMPLMAAMLTETQGYPFGDDDAHEWTKLALRPLQTHHPLTGELLVIGKSTKRMLPAQYFEYGDRTIDLLNSAGHDVPPPDPRYREQRERLLTKASE